MVRSCQIHKYMTAIRSFFCLTEREICIIIITLIYTCNGGKKCQNIKL